jgi:EAL domain-containing protein (putative c-di-GMP-specific phosphodiesterase class I)
MADLLRNAEVAQLAAKRRTRSWVWYEEAQEATRLEQLGLLSDLRLAAREHQLQMWLQPKVVAANGQLVGAEALVRWQHPVRGWVSPGDFLPFAERTGAITTVTAWMLEQALQRLVRWQAEGHGTTLSVNVSTRDLQDSGFVPALREALQRHGVRPAQLVLEVTESGLMDDPQGAVATLHALRDLGLGLSIDDFGTGYSSLAYLQTLPVHELKIDRAFVDRIDQRPPNRLLVQAVVQLGHGLGLEVTAEGVETTAEIQVLQSLGVDVLQGYVHGKPMPVAEFERWRAAR